MKQLIKCSLPISFLLFFCFHFLAAQAQIPWELAKNENGIRVFTRKMPNQDLKDYRVVAEFDATPENFLAIITNFEGYKNWFPNTEQSYLITKKSNSELIQYFQAKAPWPVSNRDCIIKFDIQKKANGNIYIELSLAKEYYDLNEKDIVHILAFEGFWEITQINQQKIKVIQQVSTNPGGAIPAWLANMVVVENPFDSFAALKKLF